MNMKYIRLSLLLLCFLSFRTLAQNSLSGMVSGKTTSSPIQGAMVRIPDLNISVVTDSEGHYAFSNVPKGNFVVEAKALGFAPKAQTIEIGPSSTYSFVLDISYTEEEEVVVTGNGKATPLRNTPQPVTEVSHDYLMQRSSTNIIDAISGLPGVSSITDGQSISKPVIRGLGYNRVVVINDGVRQEGQQWGDEFGIEVDANSVDRVEILRGPASLVYGSDALSGVINFLPEKALPEGEIKGDILNTYQTNNGLINNAGHIAGNLDGITFSARVDNTMAHAYQNSVDGYVFNTQFSNFNTDETIGIHRKWGFSQLHYSYFELRTGIAEGAKNEEGQFLKSAVDEHNDPIELAATNQELRSYTPFVINQLVKHNKLVWDNSVAVGGGNIIGRFAMQSNSRQENNDITMANTPVFSYLLNTYSYDLRYVSPDMHGINFTAGVNGMYQNSQNRGVLLVIPEYHLFDIGAFAIVNKKIGHLDLSAGIRYDSRMFRGHDNYIDSNGNQLSSSDAGALHRFNAYSSNFNGVSASLGAALQVTENFYLKANVARGFRAPNVAESGSNGIHDGTVVYEIGQSTLKPEQSLELDFTPGFKSKDITAEASVFLNSISNFIYAKKLFSNTGGDSLNNSTPGFENAAVFMYSQTDATITGGEVMVDLHPSGAKWFDWYTGYSIAVAKLNNVSESEQYLPFTPPARLKSEFTFTAKNISKALKNGYLRVGLLHSFEQANVYAAANSYQGVPAQVPTTPAYTLMNAGIGTDVVAHGRKICSIYMSVNNLTDVSYIDYMSRYKYHANEVNGVEKVGIYNMGRNICLKVLVPLDFKSR